VSPCAVMSSDRRPDNRVEWTNLTSRPSVGSQPGLAKSSPFRVVWRSSALGSIMFAGAKRARRLSQNNHQGSAKTYNTEHGMPCSRVCGLLSRPACTGRRAGRLRSVWVTPLLLLLLSSAPPAWMPNHRPKVEECVPVSLQDSSRSRRPKKVPSLAANILCMAP
jgi:hypothetical protein